MNSGNADVVPLVASEKKVEACVVSAAFDHVYDDWNMKPLAQRHRASRISARYQESPSELFSSMVVHAVFMRGAPAGKNGRPSAPVIGAAVLTSLLRSRCRPREPAYPMVTAVRPASSRWTLTFHTCTCGVSMSHCIGRIERPDVRSNGAFGKVGFANTTRGVAGGLVTVTMRFCELLVLKYTPYPARSDVRASPVRFHAIPTRGDRLFVSGDSYNCPTEAVRSVSEMSAESRPLISRGKVITSYRSPAFNVRRSVAVNSSC